MYSLSWKIAKSLACIQSRGGLNLSYTRDSLEKKRCIKDLKKRLVASMGKRNTRRKGCRLLGYILKVE
jgi:hypothetical protein